MEWEHIERSAEKAKANFEDAACRITDDKKLLDEVGSRMTSRQLIFWSYVLAFFFTAGILTLLHLV